MLQSDFLAFCYQILSFDGADEGWVLFIATCSGHQDSWCNLQVGAIVPLVGVALEDWGGSHSDMVEEGEGAGCYLGWAGKGLCSMSEWSSCCLMAWGVPLENLTP